LREAGRIGECSSDTKAFPRPVSSARITILIVIESAEAAGAFKRAFDTRFASGGA
jgi:hypothetical protein